VEAQLAGDRGGAVALVLDARAAGVSDRDLQLGVIAAAQEEIGRRWERNVVSIAQEHLATAIAQLALARLYAGRGPAAPSGALVLLACVEGEQHDFGPRIAADVLEAEGHDVRFLGANVPTGSLVELARALQPTVICLSATMVHHLPALRHAVAELSGAVPSARLLVGGLAVEQAGHAPAGAERAGVSAVDLAEAIRRRVAAEP
jgi:methanogenic corrinoid protein MtbC1